MSQFVLISYFQKRSEWEEEALQASVELTIDRVKELCDRLEIKFVRFTARFKENINSK